MDYYRILGVRPGASQNEIREAYCRSVKLLHPDLNPDVADAAEQLKLLKQAYELLRDDGLRVSYDKVSFLFDAQAAHRPFFCRAGSFSGAVAGVRRAYAGPASIEQRRREARKALLVWLIVIFLSVCCYLLLENHLNLNRSFGYINSSTRLNKPFPPFGYYKRQPIESFILRGTEIKLSGGDKPLYSWK